MDKIDIDKFALECDFAINSQDIAKMDNMLEKLIKLESLQKDCDTSIAHVLYCIANLYTEKSRLINEKIGEWRNNKFPQYNIWGLNYLRKAQNKINKNSYPYNLLEIRTNLANCLNNFCRVIEANYYWTFEYLYNQDNDANFVAPYAKANTLNWLSQFINDEGHSLLYKIEAFRLLNSLYINKEVIVHPNIKQSLGKDPKIMEFLNWGNENKNSFKSFRTLSKDIKILDLEELDYRRWCVNNILFLNPLNDITVEMIAAQDILQFPDYIVPAGEGPFFSAAFSDIKNRFCKARYIAYCGLHKEYPIWLEKNLYLTDTLDYVDFSTNAENLKIAFKLCFSILDSLAQLMNQYFGIKNDKSNCSFSSGWIKNNLSHIQNPFIDALYWLSCDLTDISKIKNWQAPNPNAFHLKIIRNDLEHNWIRIAQKQHGIWIAEHDYANILPYEELIKSTLEIFRYTRSAILYFTFAVTINEQQKDIAQDKILKINHCIYKPEL